MPRDRDKRPSLPYMEIRKRQPGTPTMVDPEAKTPITPTLHELPSQAALARLWTDSGVRYSSTSATSPTIEAGMSEEAIKRAVHDTLAETLNQEEFIKLLAKAQISADPGDVTINAAMRWGDIAWKLITVAAILVFGGWQAYQVVDGYVTLDTLNTYDQENVDPLKAKLESVEQKVTNVNTEVTTISDLQTAEKEYQRIERRLKSYQLDYNEALNEYTADKAAGKKSDRPEKSKEHRELEEEVKKAEAKLITTEEAILQKRKRAKKASE